MIKRLSFTLAVVAAVVLSLVFPEPFTQWGDFELKRLIIPILMVVINDVMAYMFGFFFGKTPLIQLSPKKTW